MIAWTTLQLAQAGAAGFCLGSGFVGFLLWWKEREALNQESSP